MSSMNFTCDSCGREVFGCTFVNGMKFCARCYQETFGETDKDRKIADLEAKLAEKERQLKLAEELLIKQEKEYDEQLEKQAKIHYKHLKEKDQDKISFAIQQLEKVKEFVNDFYGEYSASVTTNFIDNQIASLKKEMK